MGRLVGVRLPEFGKKPWDVCIRRMAGRKSSTSRNASMNRHFVVKKDDERSEDVLSLLEENARLRGLVVKLTEIILRNVAERG
jgi:hypothetical protein